MRIPAVQVLFDSEAAYTTLDDADIEAAIEHAIARAVSVPVSSVTAMLEGGDADSGVLEAVIRVDVPTPAGATTMGAKLVAKLAAQVTADVALPGNATDAAVRRKAAMSLALSSDSKEGMVVGAAVFGDEPVRGMTGPSTATGGDGATGATGATGGDDDVGPAAGGGGRSARRAVGGGRGARRAARRGRTARGGPMAARGRNARRRAAGWGPQGSTRRSTPCL